VGINAFPSITLRKSFWDRRGLAAVERMSWEWETQFISKTTIEVGMDSQIQHVASWRGLHF
jgi:hypothetical protein